MFVLATLSIVVGVSACADGESVAERDLDGEALLDRMIAFHDPEDAWSRADLELELEETRPDGPVRSTRLEIHDGAAKTRIETQREGIDVAMDVEGDAVSYTIDGESGGNVARELVERLRLGHDQMLRTRNYYTYLYGLPMKLRDPGTLVAPEVRQVEYRGRPALELRVTYDPEVGSDTWLFYADPETYELIGYRFFHDESEGDGEYIVLEGTTEVGPLFLPRERTWYTNRQDELLGTDTIVAARWLAP